MEKFSKQHKMCDNSLYMLLKKHLGEYGFELFVRGLRQDCADGKFQKEVKRDKKYEAKKMFSIDKMQNTYNADGKSLYMAIKGIRYNKTKAARVKVEQEFNISTAKLRQCRRDFNNYMYRLKHLELNKGGT